MSIVERHAAVTPPSRGRHVSVSAPSRRILDLSRLVWALAALALAALVLVPLIWIFAGSLQSDANGQWTLGNYLEGYTKSIYLEPIRNSLVLASFVAVSAVIVWTLLPRAPHSPAIPGRWLIPSRRFPPL